MGKEKQVFKEASVEAQLDQARLISNESSYVQVGTRTFKIRPTTCGNVVRISKYATRQVDVAEANTPNLLGVSQYNMHLQCKAAAIAVLNDPRLNGLLGWFKITFFHGFYWRYLSRTYNAENINRIFSHMIEKFSLNFFFYSMTTTKEMNSLKKKMTKEEVKSSQAEQKSD